MAITKDVNITINSDKCSLDGGLFFYKNDNGIRLNLSIVNLEYNIVKVSKVLSLDQFNTVEILVSKPNKKTLCIRDIVVVNGKVAFNINETLTDIVGDYLFQVRLLDSDGGKMTIPPCEYKVLEPIAIY